MEPKGNTEILAQRTHEAAREGRQPTKEGPIPGIQLGISTTSTNREEVAPSVLEEHLEVSSIEAAFESSCFSLASCCS